MHPPQYIWTETNSEGRNRYALFRHVFRLSTAPKSGKLNLFADTRYRLFVNGNLVGHGPARFFQARPEFDTHDLTPLLRVGRNVIAVIVNCSGVLCFHAEEGTGGLIAWGEARDHQGRRLRIATGTDWRAMESPAHRQQTRKLSFALNPGECFDAAAMPNGWELPDFDDSRWPAAALAPNPLPWGPLQPRSIPLLDEREVLPARPIGDWQTAPVSDEEVFSFLRELPADLVNLPEAGPRRISTAALLLTHLRSARKQTVRFSATIGDCWLNGKPLHGNPTGYNWLRFEFDAPLRAGWNTLFFRDQPPRDAWEFYLGLPRLAKLTLSATRQPGTSEPAFWLAGPWGGHLAEQAGGLVLSNREDLPSALGPWRAVTRSERAESAHIERAWQMFAPGDTTQLFDFGTMVLGRPSLEFTAAAGTRVDLHYFEQRTEDGRGRPTPHPLIRLSERCRARAGRQTWHVFHPRGFRYLEVNVTGNPEDFTLHRVSVTRANYPVRWTGRFECSDPRLNRLWELGRDTQAACMEDAFLDCPQRERGMYSGDLLVQFYVNQALFGDTRLMRRCLRLFLDAQDEEGWIPPGAHGLWSKRHPDYTALIPQNLWHYYQRTGDRAFLRDGAPAVKKILAALETLERPGTDLVDGTGRSSYIDMAHTNRDGVCCALNCFRQRALTDTARIMEVLGACTAAHQYRRKAAAVARAIRQAFWDEIQGVFHDRLRGDVPDPTPSVHGNTLAMLWDIATPKQTQRALPFVLDAIRNNARVPEPRQCADLNVNAYFSFYVLALLFRHGMAAEALDFMRTQWGRMLDAGAWTAWEFFVDVGSRCHAWACSPTHYLSSEVLGVQFPRLGDPDVVRIAPQPGGLQWASGVYPHPRGPIRVEWQVKNDQLTLDYNVPTQVEVVGGNP